MKNSLKALCALPLLALALSHPPARAYAEFGYYSGAYATPGEGGCTGADGQGINPYGGCTPGTFPLTLATAFVYGFRGHNNYATATADLAQAQLRISSHFPGGASNGPGAAANFLDTITFAGSLPAPVNVVVKLTIDSTVLGPPDSTDGTPLHAVLLNGGGLQTYYNRELSTCYWALNDGASCDLGLGHTLRTITHTETLDDTHRSFQVAAALYAGGSYLLVDGTATFSFAVPAGLSYTSASGLFATAPVPEPRGWALLLGGLGSLALLRRRRPG